MRSIPPSTRPPLPVTPALLLSIALGLLVASALGPPAIAQEASPETSPSDGSGIPTPVASAPVGQEVLETDLFRLPFMIEVPSDWQILFDEREWFAVLRPLPEDPYAPSIGIDVALVDEVLEDPCSRVPVPLDPPLRGAAQELAAWMTSLEPLAVSEPVVTEVAGQEALSFEESFVATPDCPELLLWESGGGNVYATERRRYYLFEVDGDPVVAVIVAPDELFEAGVEEASRALETLTFVEGR